MLKHVSGRVTDTNFLFGSPSFVQGAVSAFDLFGDSLGYNESLNPGQADYLAIKADWQRVGEDIRAAFTVVAEEQPSR